MPGRKRAVIYVRISSDREGAGLGVARQEAECRALAARLCLIVVAVFTDNDMSAYSGKPRPGYRQMMDAVEAGEADVILAWHTDRLHRQPRELEDYISTCEKHKVITHTVTAGHLDLSTSSGRTVARLLGTVARGEVERTIERMRSAHQQAALNGKVHGGARPFGFEPDGRTLRPTESSEIARAAHAILMGASLKSIARDWNDRGITTARGGTWEGHDVKLVLLRARNAGLRTHNGQEVAKADWPAIIPEDTWRQVRGCLSDQSRRNTPGPAYRWLGTGLYLCGAPTGPGGSECGTPLTCGRGAGRNGAKDRMYRCFEPGRHVTRIAVPLDEFIRGVVVTRMRQPDAIALAARGITPAQDAEALRDQLLALRQRKDEVAKLYARGVFDEREAAVASAENKRLIAELEERIAAAVSVSPLAGLAQAADLDAEWAGMSIPERKAAVSALMTVTVLPSPPARPHGWRPGMSYFRPERIRIDWKQPD